jgi:SET domain
MSKPTQTQAQASTMVEPDDANNNNNNNNSIPWWNTPEYHSVFPIFQGPYALAQQQPPPPEPTTTFRVRNVSEISGQYSEMIKNDKKRKLKKKRPTSDQRYPIRAPQKRKKHLQSSLMTTTLDTKTIPRITHNSNNPISNPKEDNEFSIHDDNENESTTLVLDTTSTAHITNNDAEDEDDKEGNEYKDGGDNDIIHPIVQPTNTAKHQSSAKRRGPQKIIPLQCSTRNGSKPRRSKRAKSTTLDISKPKTAHITNNKDNNHDQKKGKKRQQSRSRLWPISKFDSSDDDDDDEDDEYQPSRTCFGEYGQVMCRVPCQFCASLFQHYPILVSADLSKVHGFGVFANHSIAEDTFLLKFVTREVQSHSTGFAIRWDDGRLFDWEGTTGLHKYINHICDNGPYKPNAGLHLWRNQQDQEILSVISNRDIERDEEIFIHYGKDFLWPEPCRCPNCRHPYVTKPQRRHSCSW